MACELLGGLAEWVAGPRATQAYLFSHFKLSLSYQTPLQNTKYQDGKKNLLWVRYFYWFGKKTVGLVWSEKKYGSAFFFSLVYRS